MKTAPERTETKAYPAVPCLSKFAWKLWERAADSLSEDDLRWYAKSDEAVTAVISLVGMANSVASSIASAEGTSEWDVKQVPAILFSMAEILEGISVSLQISGDAHYRLEKISHA
ncbi:MAG: hypothetical protein LBQ75_02695 [Zoogloeaceae bacterium]|jgi:hypothetical protein|nr:hypothetical protein [Zoogloeaceae bacterium]